MSIEIRIPKLGISMEEATLVEWLVPDGSAVSEGQILYTVETDKSVQEVESPGSGTLRVIGETGETYPVGELIATLD